jgi:hypothetical protein
MDKAGRHGTEHLPMSLLGIRWSRVLAGLVAGLAAIVFSISVTGGGHGSYLPAKVFFPYTMLLTAWSGDSINLWGGLVALVEWPLYAWLAEVGRSRGWTRKVVGALIASHVMVFIAAIVFIRSFPEWPA